MTDFQVASLTTFLQITGVWMIAFQLMPTLLETETSGQGLQHPAKHNFLTRACYHIVGLATILLISRVWYLPEGQSWYSVTSLLFLIITSVLYIFLALIRCLSKAGYLTVLAAMTWLLVIATTWMYSQTISLVSLQPDSWWLTVTLYSPMMTVIILSLFLAVVVASEWVESFMSRWSDLVITEQGLPSAGKWIGRFERFLIVCCLLAHQPTGIAILITAKGILRFGEIKDDKDQKHQRRMVEYILIGSMCSYSIALCIGWIACFMIQLLKY